MIRNNRLFNNDNNSNNNEGREETNVAAPIATASAAETENIAEPADQEEAATAE